MKAKICDRCGQPFRDLGPQRHVYRLTQLTPDPMRAGPRIHSMDLCDMCEKELGEWMDQRRSKWAERND